MTINGLVHWDFALWALLLIPLLINAMAARPWGWALAQRAAGFNLLLAVGLWLLALEQPLQSGVLRLGVLQATLLVLVNFLGWIIYRYAATNFQGDSDGARFLRWLTLTLLAVQTLLLVDHLVLFWAAWVGVSLSLNQLLLFYPDRPRALLAAHKKFLIARASELLLALAIGLLYSQFNSFSLSHVMAQIAQLQADQLSWPLMLAALCVAQVALLKCAQLPLQGWLIQVVESPTPVSALLHAGVINLGGVLLLLFAPLLSQVVAAQWLLLLVAGPSAVLAALIMTTRISIKVRLAWSTCAQMGLMLVECALGLYELALLHLIAHSCYKARAFLAAGSAVNEQLEQSVSDAVGSARLPNLTQWLGASLLVVPLVAGLVWLANTYLFAAAGSNAISGSLVPWVILSVALITLVAQGLAQQAALSRHWWRPMLAGLLLAAALVALYLTLKTGLAQALELAPSAANFWADIWVCSLLLVLMATSYSLQRWPLNHKVRRLWIALNAGLYLDEWMTRFTLRWWPVTLTPGAAQPSFLDAEVKS